MRPERYNVRESEAKWRKAWADAQVFKTRNDDPRPKYYVLEMFPYPSGRIHMGHVRNYAMGDVVARYGARAASTSCIRWAGTRSACRRKTPRCRTTRIRRHGPTPISTTMRAQLQSMGLSLDWSREIATCDPSYYKHQQKLFLDFLAAGLVARKKSKVNWDPVDQTVLANEQVIDGRGWRSGAVVEQRELTQWFLKITDYSDDLLASLDRLDRWPEKVRLMQRNWIGRSEGLMIRFVIDPATLGPLAGEPEANELEIYTTRPDTLFGAKFMAIAPDHPLAAAAARHDPKLAAFIEECRKVGTSVAAIETAEKKGYDTGLRVVHPFDPDWRLPVYVANFILMEYGTGAIFGCPAHDQRDLDFVNVYGLGATPVVCPPGVDPATFTVDTVAYDGDGVMINSRFLDGMTIEAAKEEVARRLEAVTIGNRPQAKRQVNYKLRDWGISRQRYWGCPIPVIHCESCGVVPVPEKDLPVRLPEDVTFDQPGNPLDRHPTWKHVACPQCGGPARRETDTMDTFVDSSWYFARFTDPANEAAPTDSGGRRSLAAGRPVHRRHRACDPASALFALLHPGDAQMRPSRSRRAVRRPVHPGHGRARDLSRRVGGNGSRRPRCVSRRTAASRARGHGRQRRAGRDRSDREDVEVEAQHRRPGRHHRDLRRRHGALVHAVGFAARARRDLDRGRRPGRLQADAAAVAPHLRDRARRRPERPERPVELRRRGQTHPPDRARRARQDRGRDRAAALQCLHRHDLRIRQRSERRGRRDRRDAGRRRPALRLRRGGRHPRPLLCADDAASGGGMLGGAGPHDLRGAEPLAGRRPQPDRRRPM